MSTCGLDSRIVRCRTTYFPNGQNMYTPKSQHIWVYPCPTNDNHNTQPIRMYLQGTSSSAGTQTPKCTRTHVHTHPMLVHMVHVSTPQVHVVTHTRMSRYTQTHTNTRARTHQYTNTRQGRPTNIATPPPQHSHTTTPLTQGPKSIQTAQHRRYFPQK